MARVNRSEPIDTSNRDEGLAERERMILPHGGENSARIPNASNPIGRFAPRTAQLRKLQVIIIAPSDSISRRPKHFRRGG